MWRILPVYLLVSVEIYIIIINISHSWWALAGSSCSARLTYIRMSNRARTGLDFKWRESQNIDQVSSYPFWSIHLKALALGTREKLVAARVLYEGLSQRKFCKINWNLCAPINTNNANFNGTCGVESDVCAIICEINTSGILSYAKLVGICAL